MINRLFIVMLIISNFSFSGIKFGIDISSEIETNIEDFDGELEKNIVLAYENIKEESSGGFGIEYVLESRLEYSECDILSLYGIYEFYKDEEIRFFGKIGYSIPEITLWDFSYPEPNFEGGIMFGFQINFGRNLQLSYSSHSGEYHFPYYESYDIDLKRITVFQLF